MIPIDSMVFPEPPRRAAMIILGKSIIYCRIGVRKIGRRSSIIEQRRLDVGVVMLFVYGYEGLIYTAERSNLRRQPQPACRRL
jgi:hypothetical protein